MYICMAYNLEHRPEVRHRLPASVTILLNSELVVYAHCLLTSGGGILARTKSTKV